MHNG
ncbi:hypothetical protein YPPY59_0414, partial [Yersinia pestis PY-59]